MVSFEYSGSLEVEQPIDLVTTLESGQTFLWEREYQDIFEDAHSENPTYTTTRLRESREVMCMRVSQGDDGLSWESTHPDAPDHLTEIFRLDQDYQQIRQIISENDPKGVIEQATLAYPGLRVINEPLFPTLISFICSATTSVSRIRTENVYSLWRLRDYR
jgi:N-glycosylase/DNA lyase